MAIGALVAAAVLAACGGGDDDSGTREPDRTIAPRTQVSNNLPTPIPAASPTLTTASAEVTAIVGAVNVQGALIEITRLSGADVRQVAVNQETIIRRSDGRPTRLDELRPSDRIVARGRTNGTVLNAVQITVQVAVGGPAPGG